MSESTNLKKSRFSVLEILVLVIIFIAYLLIYGTKFYYLSGFSPDQFKQLLLKLEGWNSNLFETYWMNFLHIEIGLIVLIIGSAWGYLWRTRDKKLAEISTREELSRFLYHIIWLVLYLLVIYYSLASSRIDFCDIKAHNTDFTPKDIINVYLLIPICVFMMGGTILYAKTRLPFFAQEMPIPTSITYLLSLTIGPFILFSSLIKYGSIIWYLSIFTNPLLFFYLEYKSFVPILRKIQQGI